MNRNNGKNNNKYPYYRSNNSKDKDFFCNLSCQKDKICNSLNEVESFLSNISCCLKVLKLYSFFK